MKVTAAILHNKYAVKLKYPATLACVAKKKYHKFRRHMNLDKTHSQHVALSTEP